MMRNQIADQMSLFDFPGIFPTIDDDQLSEIWKSLPAGIRGYILGGGKSDKMLASAGVTSDVSLEDLRRVAKKVKGWKR